MKTTVDIPDDLFVAAKKLAAERHRSLRSLVEEGLRGVLAAGASPGRGKARIRWVTGHGGLPPGMDVSDREAMHDWLRGRR